MCVFMGDVLCGGWCVRHHLVTSAVYVIEGDDDDGILDILVS